MIVEDGGNISLFKPVLYGNRVGPCTKSTCMAVSDSVWNGFNINGPFVEYIHVLP